jgi:hypothetical protein
MTAKEFAMNHADVDPSLCSGEPTLETLDDGFAPPLPETPQDGAPAPSAEAELAFSTKSPF